MPSVSIVILNWNGRSYLQQYLASVMASTWQNKEIVIIDNASTDDSISFLQQNYPSVKIIHHPSNFGYAKGYNDALRQLSADYYILLNSDVEVVPGWIEPVIQLMESDRQIAVCQPKIRQITHRDHFEYAGAAGGWLDYLGYPFARGRVFDVCEKDEGQYDQVEPVFWASGAAMFVRASTFHELRGLDEYFFAHQEEIDFCWRAQLSGYKVYTCPKSVVYHLGGGTLPKGNARKVYLNFRNNLVMMAKNMKPAEAAWKITFRFVLDAISAFKSLLAGEGTYFIAVVRAHVRFIKWLFAERKKSLFPVSRVGNPAGFLHKSVVWSYFVRGKKKFSEIYTQNSDN